MGLSWTNFRWLNRCFPLARVNLSFLPHLILVPMFGGDQRLVKGWERGKAGQEVEEWMKTVYKRGWHYNWGPGKNGKS